MIGRVGIGRGRLVWASTEEDTSGAALKRNQWIGAKTPALTLGAARVS